MRPVVYWKSRTLRVLAFPIVIAVVVPVVALIDMYAWTKDIAKEVKSNAKEVWEGRK